MKKIARLVLALAWGGLFFAFPARGGTVVTWAGATNGPANLTNVVAVAAGMQYDLVLNADGSVAGWGNNNDYYGGYAGEATVPAGLSNVVAIASGDYDSLALKADGTVVVWGWNNCGQTNVPAGLSNVVAIAAGWEHSLALKSDGTVVTWGYAGTGLAPVPAGVSNVVSIAAGRDHSLALKADGTVVAWGDDYDLIFGTYTGACDVPGGLSNVVAVAGLWGASLALKADGTVVAWGENYDGSTSVPSDLTNVVRIFSEREDTLALKSDDTVVGWGDSSFGTPVVPAGVSNIMTLAVGAANDMALTGTEAPRQVQPPFNVTMSAEGTALFKTAFLGSPPMSYQWQMNGTNLPGANRDTLLLTNVQFALSGSYSLIVSNGYGMTQSSNATLNVLPLLITMPPTNQLLYVGDNATLSVSVSGVPPFSYQWFSNNVALSDQTNSTLALNSVTTNTSGNYNVVVTNPYGSLPSSYAVITVVPLTAQVQPASQTIYGGDDATFTVSAQKNGPFTYQWLFNETALPNQTNASLTIPAVTTNQAGNYSVLVANTNGAAESQIGVLTVVPITVSVSPASQSLYVGDTATFTAGPQKNGQFTYQWKFNGTNLPDQTNAMLMLAGLSTNQAGNYTVVAANPYGQIESSNAVLTVTDAAASFSSAPNNVFTWVGNTVNLNVSVLGSKPINYQWSFNGVPIPGATNAGLTLSPVAPSQAGVYSISVSNILGGASVSRTVSLEPVVAWGQNSSGQAQYLLPPLTNTVAVSAGNYNLALKSDGTVYSWGGVSTLPSANSNFVAVAAGYSQSLGLRSNGTVVAWGSGTLPVAPANLTNAAAIQVAKSSISSSWMTCFAIRSNSTLVGWNNYYGSILTNIPAGLMSVVGVAAGNFHALALKSDGTIAAWQDYSDYGANVPPAAVSNANNFISIAAGFSHSLALKTDGTVVAWGNNAYGQTNVPANLSNVVAIAAGGYHSLALKSDGTVTTWGWNNYGQTNTPAAFTNLIALAGGYGHTIALVSTGDPGIARQPQSTTVLIGQPLLLSVGAVSKQAIAFQWQLNGADIPGATNSLYRVAATGLANRGGYTVVITNVSGAITSSIAQVNMTGNEVVAWGLNTSGQTNVPAGLNAVAIGGGNAHSIALRADGTVAAWGTSNYGVTNVPSNVSNIVAIAAGVTHNVAMNSSRNIFSWGTLTAPPANFTNFLAIASGNNYSIGLSNGLVAVWDAPPPSGLSNAVAISAGYSQCLAIMPDGSLLNWPGGPNVPATLSNVVTLAAGNEFNLAVKTDGTVSAWGNNAYGQCNVPASLSNVVAVAAGGNHSLALKSDGTVVAWGLNTYGQTNVPAGISNVIAIAAGGFHSLAMVGSSDPTIVRQPAPVYVNVTGGLLLSVGAVSSQPLAFQWLTNGTPLPGATNSWLYLPLPQTNSSGRYSVIVSNSLGILVSSNAIVSVLSCPPFFLTQPASQTNVGGGLLTLSATVGGSIPQTYQWQKDGAAIFDATNPALLFNPLTRSNSGVYSLTVSNLFGSAISSNAILRVMVPQQLVIPIINPDGSVSFESGDSDGGLLSSNDIAHFTVSASTNLVDWQDLANPPLLTNGVLWLQDFDATNFPQRFYRIIENP